MNNKKIKVAEYVTRLEFGGVEAMLLNYTSHFLNPDSFDLHIITQDIYDPNCIMQFKKNQYTVHVVTHKRKSIIKNIREIYQNMKHEQYDIVHSHMNLTNFYVVFLGKILKVPLRISHSHSAYNDRGIKAKLFYPMLKFLNKLFANVWIACGYDAGVYLYGKKAVETGKVHIARNAIDLKRFRPDAERRKKIRAQYGIKNEFCIGHIGRFMAVKNHFFIIRIFVEILKSKPDAKLLLVGDGELREDIQNYVKEINIENSVIFTGTVLNTNELYQAMDVFLLPSLYEGLPVVTIEAQAAGLPCLISDRVDKRCAVTPYIQFFSIDKSVHEWALAILKCAEERYECCSESALMNAGYDIVVEAQKVEKLYETGIIM